jgi:hypothetical protein
MNAVRVDGSGVLTTTIPLSPPAGATRSNHIDQMLYAMSSGFRMDLLRYSREEAQDDADVHIGAGIDNEAKTGVYLVIDRSMWWPMLHVVDASCRCGRSVSSYQIPLLTRPRDACTHSCNKEEDNSA